MQLPINNRLRSEYKIPQMLVKSAQFGSSNEIGSIHHMNRELMVRIADEMLRAKPEIIQKEIMNDPFGLDYHKIQAEVYVFTEDELTELIRKVQIETATQIREQDKMTFWKNK